MIKIVKRYSLSAIVLVTVILIVYYNWLGRSRANRTVYADEFVVVAYSNDDESIEPDDSRIHPYESGRLLNLTNFRYLVEPIVCDNLRNGDDVLGKPGDNDSLASKWH